MMKALILLNLLQTLLVILANGLGAFGVDQAIVWIVYGVWAIVMLVWLIVALKLW